MTMLNPHPIRPMTDREIATILGGIVGGLMVLPVAADEMRSAVNALRLVCMGRIPIDAPQGPWVAALGGAFGAIVYCSERVDIINALDWTLENWSDIVAANSPVAPTVGMHEIRQFVEVCGAETRADPQLADQAAREQLGRDLIDAYRSAYDISDGTATRTLFVELGLRPDAVGQFGLVSSMLGMVLGTMIDYGCTFDDIQRALLGGNRGALEALPIAPELRIQAVTVLDFAIGQLEALCHPGSSQAVLAGLIGIFTRTLGAIGMGPSAAVH